MQFNRKWVQDNSAKSREFAESSLHPVCALEKEKMGSKSSQQRILCPSEARTGPGGERRVDLEIQTVQKLHEITKVTFVLIFKLACAIARYAHSGRHYCPSVCLYLFL